MSLVPAPVAPRPVVRLASLALALQAAFAPPAARAAQSPEPPGEQPAAILTRGGGRAPVRVVDGRLVVACDLSTRLRRIPANLFIELESPWGLQLHNRAAAPLRCENPDGSTIPITIHFPDFEVVVPRREHGDEDDLERFTKYHSAELGENAVVGTIGAEILARFHVVLDLAAGAIELRPPAERSGRPPLFGRDAAGTWTVPLTETDALVWLPVRCGDGRPAAIALGTAEYDSRVDALLAETLGRPAGDVGPVRLGELDLSEFVAWRPEEVTLVHPDGVFGVTGVGLLEHLRVEIDRVNAVARVAVTAPPRFPTADLAFFRARASGEPAELERFLEAHAEARLAREAAELLLEWRLNRVAAAELCAAAVRWIHDTAPKDLRATRMLDLMVELEDLGEDDVALAAGELGVGSGRDDRYPNAVHRLHGRIGHLLLERGEDHEAWRHLLSAAFGLPEDGPIQLDLGRYYERQGRLRRAFSRYVQAVIRPDSGPAALEGLQRVQRALRQDDADAEPFSVELIERMIAGKVRSFGAATKFVPDPDEPPRRTVLCEFFTNAYLGDDKAGAIGGALGNEGLLSHFEPAHAVFLSYHLPVPRPDPLCNEIAARTAELVGVVEPVEHRIDGVRSAPGAARWNQAEQVFDACRRVIEEELREPTRYALSLKARLENGVLTGELVVRGPARRGLLAQVVVAESGVLFPGKSGVVIHRRVARGSALDDPLGVPFEPADGEQRLSFRVALDELSAANEAWLSRLELLGGAVVRMSTDIDPHQVRLVGLLRSTEDGEVFAAVECEPERAEEAQ